MVVADGAGQKHAGYAYAAGASGNTATFGSLIAAGFGTPGLSESESIGTNVRSSVDSLPALDWANLQAIPKITQVLWGGPGTRAFIFWDRPTSYSGAISSLAVVADDGDGYLGSTLDAGNGTTLWQVTVAHVAGSYTPGAWSIGASTGKGIYGALNASQSGTLA